MKKKVGEGFETVCSKCSRNLGDSFANGFA